MPILVRKSRKQFRRPVPAEPLPDSDAMPRQRIIVKAALTSFAIFDVRTKRAKLPEPRADVAGPLQLGSRIARGHPAIPFAGTARRSALPEPRADVAGPVQRGIRKSNASPIQLHPAQITQGSAKRAVLPESDSFYIVRHRWSRPPKSGIDNLSPPPFPGSAKRLPGPQQIRLFADSLRYWLTGAASDGSAQTDPHASLGNYRSGTIAERTSIVHNSLIRSLVVESASRVNGPSGSIGSIALTSSGIASYTADGSATPGPATEVPLGTSVLLVDGEDDSKFVRVRRIIDTPMSGLGSVEFHDILNNVFGMADADNTESGSGGSRYRAVMVKNESSDLVSGISFFVRPLGNSATTSVGQLGASGAGTITGATDAFCGWPFSGWVRIEDSGGTLRENAYYTSRTDTALTVPAAGRGVLGTSADAGAALDVAYPVPGIRIDWEDASPLDSGNVQTIANESTEPSGRSWSTEITALTGVSASDLDNNQQGAIWIHRELPAGSAASPEMDNEIGVAFTVDGVQYLETLAGSYRIADDDIALYELHIGVGSPPDITGTPDETFSSLPHTTAATLGTDTTNYLVVNLRNKYGLVSQQTEPTVIIVDGSGDEDSLPPTAPALIKCEKAASGAFDVSAVYYYVADSATVRADQWLIYSTFDGSDPDPDVDTPTVVSMTPSDGVVKLNHTTATQSDGVTGKFIVRVRNSTTTTDSTNNDICSNTADATAPGTIDGGVFFRGVGEQSGA